MCFLTPDCDVDRTFATSVRLKFRRTVSRTMRSCWRFVHAVNLWRLRWAVPGPAVPMFPEILLPEAKWTSCAEIALTRSSYRVMTSSKV